MIENDKSRTTILNGWGRNPSPLFLKIVINLNVYLAMSGLSCLRWWDLPRSGIELVSLALQGGFLTAGPPGKPCICVLSSSVVSDSRDS